MSKRPSLAESLRSAATVPQPAAAPAVTQPAPPAPTARRPAEREQGFYAATRVGKKKVTAPLDPPDHKRLRQLALERDATTEVLLAEAISDLFIKYGKAAIGQGGGIS
jgi:hypothetical protein